MVAKCSNHIQTALLYRFVRYLFDNLADYLSNITYPNVITLDVFMSYSKLLSLKYICVGLERIVAY